MGGKRSFGDRARKALGMLPEKYDNSSSRAGERIMNEARKERNTSRFLKGTAAIADVGGAGAMLAPGGQVAGGGLLLTGAAAKVGAHRAKGRAEDLRMKSRGVDALVNKAKTGNTLGVKFSPGEAKAFAEASTKYHANNASQAPAAPSGNGVHEGGRGWANPVVQEAAQNARRARGGR